jgi:hypothetical protein
VLSKNIVNLQKNSNMNLTQEDWVSNLEADANAVILMYERRMNAMTV